MLFNYISEYRPVNVDKKLMNIFKLKYSEIYDNKYLLVEDKSLKKIFLKKFLILMYLLKCRFL